MDFQELSSAVEGTSSASMREQVAEARRLQRQRFEDSGVMTNASMSPQEVRRHCRLDVRGADLLRESVHHLGLSARAHDKVLRVARTIADLENAVTIAAEHVSEAVNYRMLDRKLWS